MGTYRSQRNGNEYGITPRHKSPGSHDRFSCHNAIPPRGCGLGVCKSDVASQTSCDHGYDETDRRTTGNKGMLGRSRDIYHDDFALAERQRRVRRE
ncbi:hypothetical protein EV363DRAFT_1401255 [Boletus edulis]|nr:hypothetical protein EV363DRAFT_1401255 [Boletus edulis]